MNKSSPLVAAMSKATGAVSSAVNSVSAVLSDITTPQKVHPIPRPKQLQRFMSMTPGDLQHVYDKYGDKQFDEYINKMLDLMEEGV